jgi:hypothetical protein
MQMRRKGVEVNTKGYCMSMQDLLFYQDGGWEAVRMGDEGGCRGAKDLAV